MGQNELKPKHNPNAVSAAPRMPQNRFDKLINASLIMSSSCGDAVRRAEPLRRTLGVAEEEVTSISDMLLLKTPFICENAELK